MAKNKRYVWNKERGCLEEYHNVPEWWTPISHDPQGFKRGLGEIREEYGRGSKREGFKVSAERNRR